MTSSFATRWLPAAVAVACSDASAASSHRNILFMIEDDGSMDMSIYGNAVIATPSMTSLASRGTVFDQMHTTVSSCSPSRASLLSGLPTHQNGMYGLQHGVEHFASFDEVVSAANVLTGAGYITGIIGKYHVWPAAAFNFTWGNSETGPGGCRTGASTACPTTDYNLVSRNVSYIRDSAAAFFDYATSQEKPFFLYIGFGDSHRCGGAVGEFCEKYGVDANGRSTIPDWTPAIYAPEEVEVPFWIQDTPIARQDLANMYTAKNRFDTGVGLMAELITARGFDDSTLIVVTSDNGSPFASGKTNLYGPSSIEPLVVVMPGSTGAVRSQALVSTLDLFPTWLDWAGVSLPHYSILGNNVTYFGQSLLPFVGTGDIDPGLVPGGAGVASVRHPMLRSLEEMRTAEASSSSSGSVASTSSAPPPPLPANFSAIYGSFQMHEIQEYFPMRSVTAVDPSGGNTSARYRLIYNIAHFLPYPIASDLWSAPATQDLVTRMQAGQPTNWFKNATLYFEVPDARGQYELFDLVADPMELVNVVNSPAYGDVATTLKAAIKAWQTETADDWLIKYSHE